VLLVALDVGTWVLVSDPALAAECVIVGQFTGDLGSEGGWLHGMRVGWWQPLCEFGQELEYAVGA